MSNNVFSKKQQEVISLFKHGKLRRINLLSGSVRSGKTWISLVLWALWVASMPASGNFLMVAKTLNSLKRNALDLLADLIGAHNFSYSISKKEGCLFGRRIFLEGVSDARAESKIRGLTLHGAYCDELTLFTQDFFTMLLSRLSPKGAKLFATTNPDNPNHWLMKQYIERSNELDMLYLKFSIEDNCFLDPDYIASLKREYSGVFYERFILGNWVVAEGLVYPMFDPARHVINDAGGSGLYYISIDYGTLNPCSMGLWRLEPARAVRIAEFYHDGRASRRQLTDEEYYNALEQLASGYLIQQVIIDPSAASFIETIRRHGKFSVHRANNAVLDGIRVVSGLLEANKLFFDSSCSDSIREFQLYAWDDNASDDRVIKEFDHAMDDIRYFCNTIAKRTLFREKA